MKARHEHVTRNAEETRAVAQEIGLGLKPNSVLALFGDLGSGKTTFVQGIASYDEISSPTFSYLHIHSGSPAIYHFDLYRLLSSDDFTALGFQDYFFAGGICCIEWSEKISSLLPKDAIRIYFEHLGGDLRKIVIER